MVDICEADHTVNLKRPDSDDPARVFTYDAVYGPKSTQQQVYDETAFSLVESVLEGYNGKFSTFLSLFEDWCFWFEFLVVEMTIF